MGIGCLSILRRRPCWWVNDHALHPPSAPQGDYNLLIFIFYFFYFLLSFSPDNTHALPISLMLEIPSAGFYYFFKILSLHFVWFTGPNFLIFCTMLYLVLSSKPKLITICCSVWKNKHKMSTAQSQSSPMSKVNRKICRLNRMNWSSQKFSRQRRKHCQGMCHPCPRRTPLRCWRHAPLSTRSSGGLWWETCLNGFQEGN